MALSNDVFLAILAMDAYNRGYGAGLGDSTNGLGGVGSQIGNATVSAQSDITENSAQRNASFYAQSYTLDGKTIIAYRGTDNASRCRLG
ncbi:MAG: hypothetical protein ABL901_16935 [Hyphomicrobiaceae bacterium]|nr:hypothetical protein [Hyphomicrobiaceae bacterium]